MELMYLIDKLEDLAAGAKKMPITGRTMVDRERLVELVEQLRFAVPKNIQEATEVIEHRSQLISQTANEVRRLRATAEREVADARRREHDACREQGARGGDYPRGGGARQADTGAQPRRRPSSSAGARTPTPAKPLLELETKVAEVLETIRKGVAAAAAAAEMEAALASAAPSNGNAPAGAAS